MNLEQEDNPIKLSKEELQDNADSLVEIEKAFQQIDKLKNKEEGSQDQQEEEIVEDNSDLEEEDLELEPELNEEEEVEELEKPEKLKKPTKIWKEKKRKYQAIAEKEAIKAEKVLIEKENLELKAMVKELLNTGTYHYSRGAYSDLERAKDNLKKSLDAGDPESFVDAQIAFSKAMHTVNDLEKWNYNEPLKEERETQHTSQIVQSDYINEHEQEVIKDWLEDHPYLNPESRKYDEKVATKVVNFVNALDNGLANRGQEHLVFSDRYFNTINNYISREIKKEPKKRSDSIAPVGAVRNSYSSLPSSNPRIAKPELTTDEKFMAQSLGITEEEWLREKIKENQN